jgi:hydroxyacylglutathione hydrolase
MIMKVEHMPVGAFDVNCYILVREDGQCLIIDPGAEAEEIESLLDEKGLTVAAYLLSHGHMDHISALATLAARRPAPIYMHPEDLNWAFGELNQMPPYYPVPERPESDIIPLESGDVPLEGWGGRIIHTPGHTPGGLCFHFPSDNFLISGDTLFKGSVGRTDFPGGDARELTRSLKLLAALPPETIVYPGHGPATTIAEELANNYFMR